MKYFDRLQLIITIAGISCLVLTLVFQVITTLTATPIYDEMGLLEGYDYELIPQTFLSIFTFAHIGLLTWFIARSITFQMRKKEWEQEKAGY